MTKFKIEIVKVTWLDAFSSISDKEYIPEEIDELLKEFEDNKFIIENIGFLVGETKTYIIIFNQHQTDTNSRSSFKDYTVIIKKNIIKKEILQGKKK